MKKWRNSIVDAINPSAKKNGSEETAAETKGNATSATSTVPPNMQPITIYGYSAQWGLPDISPYVTKLIYYLKMAKVPFEYKSQNLAELDNDAPYGKLPYIIDSDGTKVGDSNQIIEYLEKKHGVSLDKHLSPADKAIELAFERMVGEHLYWSGIIEPRWRLDEGFEMYVPYLVNGAEVTPEIRAVLDGFRQRILAGFNGQGMGRRDSAYVLDLYKADISAIADFLGNKQYIMGNRPSRVDAVTYAMLRHCTDHPQKWPGTGYVETKKNLVDYMGRMKKDVGI